jgi:serine/threonine protein kinase
VSLHPGKQISPSLRLSRLLGGGAMGSVWLADHLTLQTQVAVKFMTPAMAEDEVSVQRFRQEARAAADIKSPHVVQVFDHGVASDGQLYIVMELLDGESLEKRVRHRGALPAADCVRIVGQIAKALAKAHERGIVHRDIKPSNVFVIDAGGEPFVKLLDFGVAKFSGEEAMQMTAAGNMVGTPAYMSPEQLFHGKQIDHRGDLWSLAVVTYYALTGVRPFEGKTLGELAVAINRGTFRSPTELRNDLPPEIDAWFRRAFHADLEQRFGTAKDAALQLERACGLASQMTSTPSGVATQLQTFPGTSISSPPIPAPQPASHWPLVAAALGAAAVTIAGVALVVLLSGSQPPAAAAAIAPAASTPATPAPQPVAAPAPAPAPAPSVTAAPSVITSSIASAEPKKPMLPPPPAEPKGKGDSRSEQAAKTLGL